MANIKLATFGYYAEETNFVPQKRATEAFTMILRALLVTFLYVRAQIFVQKIKKLGK
jgi:hypothetical protein